LLGTQKSTTVGVNHKRKKKGKKRNQRRVFPERGEELFLGGGGVEKEKSM